jgi:Fur family ferric uptake transcriptional regulator
MKLKKAFPTSNIGIATVYRALSFLEEVDLITSITFGTDGKKYESNSKSHHDHLICTSCGKIIEFIDEEIEKRQDKIAKKNRFKILSHSMQLYGICENCQ